MTLSASASDDEKAAAYEFFRYWNSPKSQQYWAVNSGFPPTRTDVDAAQLQENPYVAEFGKYSDQSKFYLTGVQEYRKVNTDIWEPTLQRILNGDDDTQDLLQDANDQIQAALEEQG